MKSITIDYTGYNQQSINSISIFIDTFFSWRKDFVEFFTSQWYPWLIYQITSILFACVSLILVLRILLVNFKDFKGIYIPVLLIANAIALYCLVCFSEWYVNNEANSRYMISTFYLFFIGIMILLKLHYKNFPVLSKIVLTLAVITVFLGSYTGLDMKPSDRFIIDPKNHKQFENLHGKGIIGSYWYTYVISAFDPNRIAATPRNGDWLRSHHERIRTFECDTIFVVKNLWLESYPDSLNEYDIPLFRIYPNHDIFIGNAEMSAYSKQKTKDTNNL
jgi:hypothetical protein